MSFGSKAVRYGTGLGWLGLAGGDQSNAEKAAGIVDPTRPDEAQYSAGYNQILKEGTAAPGSETPWTQAMKAKQGMALQDATAMGRASAEQMARNSAASMSGAGGMDIGARERIAQNKDRMGAAASAQAAKDYQGGLLDIGAAAEKNRLGMLQAAANAENAKYAAAMQEYGANKLANTQEKLALTTGGLFGKGGFLGLGI